MCSRQQFVLSSVDDFRICEVVNVHDAPCCRRTRRPDQTSRCSRLATRNTTQRQRFFLLSSVAFLNMFSVAIANNILNNHSAGAKRQAPKLSRVEIDVDYSSLLLPRNTRTDSQSPTDASICSNDASPFKGAEESSFSSNVDFFSLRLRGGHMLRRQPASDACNASGEALQHLRAAPPT
uniref:Uncharacterized protein n=1 Tax=Cryptomonas curvata TaxID=233186 RepID=A0A7S0M126_9CRYP|mmetsp:Transcript_19755/g.41417  ORF Transcript_19755/g.41417 Transcript_19755/m.41417 type:complete len:179 (+) Transcript_19755:201-737(+)